MAAGLLQQRNMLSLFTKLKPTVPSQDSGTDSDDEDQKEKDAEELALKIQKLQDLGFIKMVNK